MPLPLVTVDPATKSQRPEHAEHGAADHRSAAQPRPMDRRLLLLIVGIAIGGLLFAVVRVRGREHIPAKQERQTFLRRPDEASPLRLNGTTEAVESRSILAPLLSGQRVDTLTITKLVPAGSRVKPGELLAEFDRQAQMREFIDKRAQYDKLANQVLEEQAKESAARATDETEIKQAENSLSKAKLEMQKIEIVSRIDSEKARENLDESEATLAQLRATFDLKRAAARAAIHILEIQRDRNRETMAHAQANSELMQVRSPIDGIVVLNTIWKLGKMGEVQEGDQIRPGVSFMQVVDPLRMQVRAQVNQEDFFGLKLGQTAKVHLDAYPELVFPGKVEELSPIARSGDFSSKLRTFIVVFSIEGSHPKLMPDLSAAIDLDPVVRAVENAP